MIKISASRLDTACLARSFCFSSFFILFLLLNHPPHLVIAIITQQLYAPVVPPPQTSISPASLTRIPHAVSATCHGTRLSYRTYVDGQAHRHTRGANRAYSKYVHTNVLCTMRVNDSFYHLCRDFFRRISSRAAASARPPSLFPGTALVLAHCRPNK